MTKTTKTTVAPRRALRSAASGYWRRSRTTASHDARLSTLPCPRRLARPRPRRLAGSRRGAAQWLSSWHEACFVRRCAEFDRARRAERDPGSVALHVGAARAGVLRDRAGALHDRRASDAHPRALVRRVQRNRHTATFSRGGAHRRARAVRRRRGAPHRAGHAAALQAARRRHAAARQPGAGGALDSQGGHAPGHAAGVEPARLGRRARSDRRRPHHHRRPHLRRGGAARGRPRPASARARAQEDSTSA